MLAECPWEYPICGHRPLQACFLPSALHGPFSSLCRMAQS